MAGCTTIEDRNTLVRKSCADKEIARLFQRCCDIILDGDTQSFRDILAHTDLERRKLLTHHLGDDGNMLIHRLCKLQGETTLVFIELMYQYDCLNPECPNRESMYPLHILANNGNADIARALLSYGANTEAVSVVRERPAAKEVIDPRLIPAGKSKPGYHAVHYAAERLDFAFLSLLSEYRANLFSTTRNGEDCEMLISQASSDPIAGANWLSLTVVNKLTEQGLVNTPSCETETSQEPPKRSARAL